MDTYALPVIGVTATCIFAYFLKVLTAPAAKLPFHKLKQYAQESFGDNLLMGKTAIVTGSSAGIGLEIATTLYKLHANVIIASRTLSKCNQTVEDIKKVVVGSKGSLKSMELDTSDLNKVAKFVNEFKASHNELHFLVNNAGIMYFTHMDKATPEKPLRTPQGYDQAFATNFMGHYLLTELLLPLLKSTPKARVVSISSSVHLQVDGKAMLPTKDNNGKLMPLAARSDVYTLGHWVDSYGNSKLAQIYHMNTLMNKIRQDADTDLKVLSICPGFVATDMVPDRPVAKLIAKFFFSREAAVYAPVYGCVSKDVRGGEWVTNFRMIWTRSRVLNAIFNAFCAIGLRDFIIGVVATPEVILFQHETYGIHKSKTSKESHNDEIRTKFIDWCDQEIASYKK